MTYSKHAMAILVNKTYQDLDGYDWIQLIDCFGNTYNLMINGLEDFIENDVIKLDNIPYNEDFKNNREDAKDIGLIITLSSSYNSLIYRLRLINKRFENGKMVDIPDWENSLEYGKWKQIIKANFKSGIAGFGKFIIIDGSIVYFPYTNNNVLIIPKLAETVESIYTLCRGSYYEIRKAIINGGKYLPPYFLADTKLEEIQFNSNSITTIPNSCFKETSLSKINIPSNIVIIEDNAFGYCNYLKEIKFNGPVKSIGVGAFRDCRSLNYIEIPDGIEVLPIDIFKNCESMDKVFIPNSIRHIEKSAFEGTFVSKIYAPRRLKDILYKLVNVSFIEYYD